MNCFIVNLDYESSLFDPLYQVNNPASLRTIKEFEYVFFIVNNAPAILKNIRTYDEDYLNHMKKLGFTLPELNPKGLKAKNWWGALESIELESKLNSKLTSALLAQKHNWGFFSGTLVTSLAEIQSHIDHFPNVKRWLLKKPHSFSGIGHYQLDPKKYDEEKLSNFLDQRSLLEPQYERVFDIGTTFVIENGVIKKQFMVENFNSVSGGFKGGAGSHDHDTFKKYIRNKYQYDLTELENITNKIVKTYIDLGATSNTQIDSFVYKEDGHLKLYALVEVNYRKTMGLVIQSLAEKYNHVDIVEWKIFTPKDLKHQSIDSNWIKLSPDGNHFQSYACLQYLS
jgi:hypothetical protein